MRIVVRLISACLSLLVALIGAALLIETTWAWLRPHAEPLLIPWRSAHAQLDQLHWQDTPVLLASGGLAVLGALLVLAAATARGVDIRLHDPAPEVAVTTNPRSLARLIGHHIRNADGVTSASVTASRRRIRIRVRSPREDRDELSRRLTETAETVVEDLPISRTPTVSVAVDPARNHR